MALWFGMYVPFSVLYVQDTLIDDDEKQRYLVSILSYLETHFHMFFLHQPNW